MPSSVRRPHILVVDDEVDLCWALGNILRPEGYQVTTVTSGKEALELAKRNHFEVVFIDAKLPDVDGIELSSEIKKIDPDARIVIISGYFYREDEAIDEGLAHDLYVTFIGKPFALDEVRAAARKALTMAGGQGMSAGHSDALEGESR